MYKLVFTMIFFMLLVVIGCEINRVQPSQTKPAKDGTQIEVIEFDGCEYLQFKTSDGYFVSTHKGNCKYCEQRRKDELESLRKEIIKGY